MTKKTLAFVAVLLFACNLSAQEKKYKVHTIAFYNVENLFDTADDTKINDEEWLITGKQNWTQQKYEKKLQNLAKVISEIGTSENPNAPTILGVAEVENRGVLEDLIQQSQLSDKGYGIIHFDSPDRRGIDVGLLYQKKHFIPTSYKNIPLIIYKKKTKSKIKKKDEEELDDKTESDKYTGRIFTRDQLLVTGLLDGEEIHFIVNHWPSRSGGEKKSSPNREAAAALNKKITDSLYSINPDAKIVTMGDFNDGPYNKSIKKVLGAKASKDDINKEELYNPMEEMSRRGIGTLAYRDAWDLFDQIIISEALTRKDYTSYSFWKAGVYNKAYMMQSSGRYKGYPQRNWNGVPGYSDHFPVYMYLIKQM